MGLFKRVIDGLLESESIVDLIGKFEIEDKTNGIVARFFITEKENALISGVFGMFSKRHDPEPIKENNEIKLNIFKRIGGEKLIFSQGSGNYARYLQIDKKIYFMHSKIQSVNCQFDQLNDKTLPSSSILRKETELIKSGKFEEAQKLNY